jgi:peptidoglycan-associated lipoprotein
MRWSTAAAAATFVGLVALLGGACGDPGAAGSCETSTDCAAQPSFGPICVDGRCLECVVDGDCKPGFVCRTSRCVPRPECAQNADCPAGRICANERCVVPP